MSVPTKTGLEIWDNLEKNFENRILQNQEWVLLEDHQKREQELLTLIDFLQNLIAMKAISINEMERCIFGVGGKKNG